MKTIDLHADTLTMMRSFETLQKNHRMVDIKALKTATGLFSAFLLLFPRSTYHVLLRMRFRGRFISALQTGLTKRQRNFRLTLEKLKHIEI